MVGEVISITGKIKLLTAVMVLVPLMHGFAHAQSPVRLKRSVSPAAALIFNALPVASSMPMEIAVRLNLRHDHEMEQLKRDQQDRSSPSYHKWLTPAQFNARFGPTQADANAVAQWLSGAGFKVTEIDPDRHLVAAKASAVVVARTLDIAMVSNGTLFANTTEPAVPAALAPLIANIEGLHNTFAVRPALVGHRVIGPLPEETDGAASSDFAIPPGFAFKPSDFRTYYNETPLIQRGNSGTNGPDCIALAEVSNLHLSSVAAFTRGFGLPPVNLSKVFASGPLRPGFNDAEVEDALDVEYAHVAAPATPIRLYIGAGENDLQDAISEAVTSNKCGVISISFEYCGMQANFYTATLGHLFAEAALQGQSVFVSAGDNGAAGFVPLGGGGCGPGISRNVSEMSAEPDVTSVGGTEFDPIYNSSSGRDVSTVQDELDWAWNEDDEFQGATGGGISSIFARPSWQTGASVPAGSMRSIPDVALGASGSQPGYYIVGYFSGRNQLAVVAGTSLSAPSWAGYSRLIAKASGNRRLGLMNTRLYQLGNMGSESGLIDVIRGNNWFDGVPGYYAEPGYDMTTGWGSPDMSTLLNSYLAK